MKSRKKLCLLLALALIFTLVACGSTKTVTCDHCGKEITLNKNSNITDEWIVYCKTCEKELFGEDGLIS